jgi:SAM-dependent methyltransferase
VTDPRVVAAASRFGDVAARYEEGRPGYADQALDDLVARTGPAPGIPVLDLGAGTGKLTRQLRTRGIDVVAVEPSEGMRAQLAAAVPGTPVLDGTAEAIPLADASVGVVCAAQAFHWFRTRPALDEIARVLRRRGWLALIWNELPRTGWAAEMWDLRHELTGFRPIYPGNGWEYVLAADDHFGPRSVTAYEVTVTTTVEAELADTESRSYVHTLEEAQRRTVLDAVRRFLATNADTAGRTELTYVRPCTLHLIQRVA